MYRNPFEERKAQTPDLTQAGSSAREASDVKISDVLFSGNHTAICTFSIALSSFLENPSIISASHLEPTLECGWDLL